jgi:hypothetical protein
MVGKSLSFRLALPKIQHFGHIKGPVGRFRQVPPSGVGVRGGLGFGGAADLEPDAGLRA